MAFLKRYAIGFDDASIDSLDLRRLALDKLEFIQPKQSMKSNIRAFLIKTLRSRSISIHVQRAQSSLDLTYAIEGIQRLFQVKSVGQRQEQLYGAVSNDYQNQVNRGPLIQLMVQEAQYWYWCCTPDDRQNHGLKRMRARCKRDLKLRLDFIKSVA